MSFERSKMRMLYDMALIFLTVLMAVIIKTPYTYLWIILAVALYMKYYPASYKIEDNIIMLKKFKTVKYIAIDSIKHLRKTQSSNEEHNDDKMTSYLISSGDTYELINRSSKNKDGKTLVDVLINDYQIPIKYEKAILFIKTKIEDEL